LGYLLLFAGLVFIRFDDAGSATGLLLKESVLHDWMAF
jgi:hypothetical protein